MQSTSVAPQGGSHFHMRSNIPWLVAVATTALVACGQDKDQTSPKPNDPSQVTTGQESEESEADSATERWRANWAWYNDDAPYAASRRGHAFSQKYMQFLNGVAAQERARFGAKIP